MDTLKNRSTETDHSSESAIPAGFVFHESFTLFDETGSFYPENAERVQKLLSRYPDETFPRVYGIEYYDHQLVDVCDENDTVISQELVCKSRVSVFGAGISVFVAENSPLRTRQEDIGRLALS